MTTDMRPDGGDWLLLLFFLPSKQAHARVQAWRRLQRIGAVLLNNSAYVLPQSPESREDFEWIRGEIAAAGGQATVLSATTTTPAASDAIADAFRAARQPEFEAVARQATQLLKQLKASTPASRQVMQRARRLREQFETSTRLDFFDTPERDRTAGLLAELDQRLGRTKTMTHQRTAGTTDLAVYRGKMWVTRPRPGVDRMASAWFIRRFVDANATFTFGEPRKIKAIPFDTFEAEFGHHGSHCTFETFCERFAVADPAVLQIGRIVHDLDLKEQTHREAQTVTIGNLVEGLRRSQPDDNALLSAGIAMFEALYQSLAAAPPPSRASSRKPTRWSRARPRTSARR